MVTDYQWAPYKGNQLSWFGCSVVRHRALPTLRLENAMCSSATVNDLQSEILHLFLFLKLRPLINASKVGFFQNDVIIFPRIIMIMSDQKQERPFVALNSINSTRDCTACDMLSRFTTAEAPTRTQDSALRILQNGQEHAKSPQCSEDDHSDTHSQ